METTNIKPTEKSKAMKAAHMCAAESTRGGLDMGKRILMCLGAILIVALTFTACSKQDPFANSIYSEQPDIVTYQDYLAKTQNLPKEGVDPILATGTQKASIKKSGLLFKDSNGNGQLDKYEDWRLTPEERSADLVSKLTWEQKLGLLSWGGQRWLGAPTGSATGDTMWYGIKGLEPEGTILKGTGAESIVTHGLRHSNLNLSLDPVDEAKFLNNVQGLVERTDLGIPFFWCSEISFSYSNKPEYDLTNPPTSKLSPWPQPMGLGAADDLGVTRRFGEIVRDELRMRGRHATWGPMADLATEPRWSRVASTIHAEGEVVASHIEVLVNSIQAANADKNVIGLNGMVVFLKHFPGMGPNEDGMDSHTYPGRYNIYPGKNIEEHLLPFRAGITDAQAGGIMIGYSIVDTDGFSGVAPAYDPAVYDLLYSLGFTGDTVTDNNPGAWGIDDLELEDGKRGEKAAIALKAGANHWLGGDYYSDWQEADSMGLLDPSDVDRAVTTSLQLQFKLGLFENPYVDIEKAVAFWDTKGSAMQNRVASGKDAMAKSMVLVKNAQTNGADVLPIIPRNADIFDANGNGSIDVYYDSKYDGYDSGEAKTFATTDRYPNRRNFVSDVKDADVAVIRIFARDAIYKGLEGGIPLSFDAPAYKYDRETGMDTDELLSGDTTLADAQKEMARLQVLLDAKKANPNLKIVVGMTAIRPSIVEPFLADIDGMFIDFGATDDVFLDMIFNHEGLNPVASLPIEFPSSDASAEAQFEDLPGDSVDPTFPIGFGLDYMSTGY